MKLQKLAYPFSLNPKSSLNTPLSKGAKMSYSKKSLREWQEEQKYLANCYTSKDVPANFNKDFNCFLSYVKMQSNFAFRDGFPGVCFQMREGFNTWAGKEQFTKTECGLPEA